MDAVIHPGRIPVRVARLIASGFGIGRIPVAAGTVAAFAATLAGAALLIAASSAGLALAAPAVACAGSRAVFAARAKAILAGSRSTRWPGS